MHYKNGRKAQNGDKVILLPDPQYGGGMPLVGILYDAKMNNDYCNGKLAVTKPNDPVPNLRDCLHIEDFLMGIGDPSRFRDQEHLQHEEAKP